jgi:hypothetical protein
MITYNFQSFLMFNYTEFSVHCLCALFTVYSKVIQKLNISQDKIPVYRLDICIDSSFVKEK